MKEMSKRRKIFSIGLLVLVMFIVIGATASSDEPKTDNSNATGTPKVVEAPKPADNVPAEHKSALSQAKNYSSTMHMSKQGVYDQLVSEYGGKFTPVAAQYAIDNVKADWNANALAKAKTYQATMSMSPAAIRDQLISPYGEKFTESEADYAIANLNS